MTHLKRGRTRSPWLPRRTSRGFVPPKDGSTITFKVAARKGTTLTFVCLVHPWMQAKLQVS
jgi:hypothetical protein